MRMLESAREALRVLARERGALPILLVGLAGIGGGWALAREHGAQRQQAAFRLAAEGAAEAVGRRMADYVQVLRGGAAFLHASRYVSPEEWHTYVGGLDLATRYPGIQAMAYAELVDEPRRPELEQAMRREGLTDFKVWPAGPRARYAVVRMIEPAAPAAESLFGFDLLSDPARRQALARACDLGEPVLSSATRLSEGLPDAALQGMGSLLYLPLFRYGAAVDSVAARRRELVGYLFAPFRVQDLMRGVLGEGARTMQLTIYDLGDGAQRTLIYRDTAGTPAGDLVEELEVALPERRWLLQVQATPFFMAATVSSLPLALAGGGGILLLLLSALLLQRARQAQRVERRATEMTAELRSSEERFRRVVDTIPSGMLIVDASGRILFANRQLAEIFGYTEAALCEMHIEDLVPVAVRAQHVRERDAYMRHSQPRPMGRGSYLSGLRQDGREVPLEVALAPLQAGEAGLVLALVTDVSERRRHEQELAEAKTRAEAANEAKSAFLANMSHELRTPLNAVLGMAQLLGFTTLDARQQDYLRTLHSASSSLLALLNDILDLSRIEAGQLEIAQAPFRVADPVRRVEDLLLVSLRQKGLALRVELDPAVPACIVGDARRVQQVLANLLGNAVKFTEHGEIGLHVAPGQGEAAGMLVFRVRDTGIGMTPEQMAQLFAPFSQADTSATRRFGGSGLGLAIAKRLVGLMGGEIGVSSVAGQGSEFWFGIPLQPADEACVVALPEAEPAPGVYALSGLRVLLVEDNRTNQLVARRLLEEAGIVIEAVTDGTQALASLRRQPSHFHLVLMDVQMPHMDGLQATRLIRQEWGAELPVIGLSAGVMLTERQAALEAGMDDFIAKPLDATRLYAVLARCAQRIGFVAERPSPAPAAAVDNGASMPVIAGLEPAEALLRLGNKPGLYREVLGLFAREEGRLAERVRACLAAGELRAAVRHLHTLKSAAANIGAGDLARCARAVEEQLLRDELVQAGQGLDEIERELARLIPLIKQALDADAAGPAAAAQAGMSPVHGDMPALLAALRANDFQAIELFAGLSAGLRGQLGEAASRELADAIEMLDFERALRLLEGLALR